MANMGLSVIVLVVFLVVVVAIFSFVSVDDLNVNERDGRNRDDSVRDRSIEAYSEFDAPALPRDDGVSFASPRDCDGLTCYDFAVKCENSIEQTGTLRVRLPDGTPKHNVFFTTGGPGKTFYDEKGEITQDTLNFVVDNGARAIEVRWNEGWIGLDQGIVAPSCVYGKVLEEFLEKYPVDGNVCVQGNSGGGEIIAYTLAYHDGEDLIDTAIITGGPPLVSFNEGCKGEASEVGAGFSGGSAALSAFDEVLGANGECADTLNDGVLLPEDIANEAEAESLIDRNLERKEGVDYDYSNNVFFVSGEGDPTLSPLQGILFHDIITATNREWFYIPIAKHEIDNTDLGAEKIRELLDEYCFVDG